LLLSRFNPRVFAILAPSHIQRLIERARQFSAQALEAAAAADELAAIDPKLWPELHRSGLAMAAFPEELGGAGLCESSHHAELCTVLRLLGAGDLSIARLFEGHVNAIFLVSRYGTAAQLRALADAVADGAMSAVWGADDAGGLKITGDAYPAVLEGRKILASGAGLVTWPLVTAKGAGRQLMCLLTLAADHPVDLSRWQAQGMRSTATGTVDLSGIIVTPENIVGAAGDFMRQPLFSGGAWRFCAAHLGAVERLVDLFRDHLVARDRAQDPYQLQRVAQCVASARTARFWVEEAARRFSAPEEEIDLTVAFANLTRTVVERAALDVMETVQRGVGLVSFIRPHPIERITRDLATYLRQPVPDRAMSDAARAVLASPLPIGEF
jgi:alkylation response protein AidB-like acyl-CoA dehydrogenase